MPNDRIDLRAAMLILTIVTIVAVSVYYETLSSIVRTWNFDGYSHGFIVLPICIYLVWRERQRLFGATIEHSYVGIAALLALSAIWWLGDSGGIQIVRQIAVVGMAPMVVLAIFGFSFAKVIRFALAYLLFAVPFGEILVPYLVDFTATFSVDLLNIFGIPVFQDGQYFHVPSGSYEVAKACAGLGFFLSTLALAALYGHILFSSPRKLVLFIGISAALSIVTNGIRATTIVLLLHFTELDIAAGEDHVFVGWILYGLLIGLMIWIGQRYADPESARPSTVDLPANPQSQNSNSSRRSIFAVGILAVFAVSTGPILKTMAGSVSRAEFELVTGLPIDVAGWAAKPVSQSTWRPDYVGYSQMSLGTYANAGENVDVALIRYSSHQQGAEITNAVNSVANTDEWTLGDVAQVELRSDLTASIPVSEIIASRAVESRVIWYWTEVGGIPTNGALQTKLAEIRNTLGGNPSVSSAFILAVTIDNSVQDSRQVLRNFLKSFYVKSRNCVVPDLNYEQCSLDAPIGKET